MSEKEIDDVSGIETTGHSWDGIRELNNPLPRWWVWTFYITIVWAIGYCIAYPAWPMISSATTGMLGYSSRAEVEAELAAATEAQSAFVSKIAEMDVAAILEDDNLRQFATSAGAAAFKINCIQCHGSGAQGSPGYPNLNDDDWLWGGTPDAIYLTIAHGIRFDGDDDTRVSDMPAFVDVLEAEEINQVAAYVVSLTGEAADTSMVEPGKVIYVDNCAVCHGDNGEGLQELGGPNLADAIWLYGETEADIAKQIRAPKHGAMPAWQARLGETTVKQLAVYVHSLGGGE